MNKQNHLELIENGVLEVFGGCARLILLSYQETAVMVIQQAIAAGGVYHCRADLRSAGTGDQ
jgi:hypothetical protein